MWPLWIAHVCLPHLFFFDPFSFLPSPKNYGGTFIHSIVHVIFLLSFFIINLSSTIQLKPPLMKLPSNQTLAIDEKALKWSMIALRLSVLVETMVSYMLQPSYAIMVDQGSHQDSFPSTAPFDFSTATYVSCNFCRMENFYSFMNLSTFEE